MKISVSIYAFDTRARGWLKWVWAISVFASIAFAYCKNQPSYETEEGNQHNQHPPPGPVSNVDTPDHHRKVRYYRPQEVDPVKNRDGEYQNESNDGLEQKTTRIPTGSPAR